jgi:ABC-type transporter Mla MlaB component
MAVGVSREENEVRVVLSGDVTVGEAESLHHVLKDLVGADMPVVVEESELMAVDTSAVQLVLAFGRARLDAGLSIRVTEGEILTRLRQLGLHASLAG